MNVMNRSARTMIADLARLAIVVSLCLAGLEAAAGDTPLVDAVKRGDEQVVRRLLDRVDVNAVGGDGASALHWAAQQNAAAIADLLIRAGGKVDAANDYGVTPLSVACATGNSAVAKLLLAAGASPNRASDSGETPLIAAAGAGAAGAVEALVAAGADLETKEPSRGQTALMWGVAGRHRDVVRMLIKAGASPDAESASGFTALMFAAREGGLEEARLLLAAGAKANHAARDGSTPLLVATVRGHWDVAELLLKQGANPNAGSGFTPLHWAAGAWETQLSGEFGSQEYEVLAGLRPGKLDFVKLLVTSGADVNARITRQPPRFGFSVFQMRLLGATPFFLAAHSGDVDIMRFLVSAGADPSIPTNQNTTPIMAAAGLGRIIAESRTTEARALAAVRSILELGADVKAVNDRGETALHGAAYHGADSIVRLLVDRGAEINPKSKCGWTPLTIAEGVFHSGGVFVHPKTVDLLRKLGGTSDPAVVKDLALCERVK
jgi:ankyrin repeat protein